MAEGILKDFDDKAVYDESQRTLLKPETRNFVVQFGRDEAEISFDLNAETFGRLLNDNDPPRDSSRHPVRWINLWAPNKQHDVVKVIGNYYDLTDRFKAILESPPVRRHNNLPVEDHGNDGTRKGNADRHQGHHSQGQKEFGRHRENDHGSHRGLSSQPSDRDPEKGMTMHEEPSEGLKEGYSSRGPSHYDIASSLINYQLVDQDKKFLCVGANWIYQYTGLEGGRLFSWLFLCIDSTVISIQEDPQTDDEKEIRSVRDHVINVLSQISNKRPEQGSVSVISVRTSLVMERESVGFRGSSNLFYYLFDNWAATYYLILDFKRTLGMLGKEILEELDKKHIYDMNKHIIPGIYTIGNKIRRNQHLYEGYENLIQRILERKESGISGNQPRDRVEVESSAINRFNRLQDHIKLLVLSSLREALEEKDALLTTYFNITAQKDSQATSKLSRNATLLSKLGILFIPVSLVTSYFSIQIEELQGVYTVKTYWVSFTVTLVLSFIALFLFSRFLMRTMEGIERQMKITGKRLKHILS